MQYLSKIESSVDVFQIECDAAGVWCAAQLVAPTFRSSIVIGANSIFLRLPADGHNSARETHPILLATLHKGQIDFFFQTQIGEHGCHFHRFWRNDLASEQGVGLGPRMLARARVAFDRSCTFFSDDCGYTKWCPELELERKFTFKAIPDIWALTMGMYAEILQGKLVGYVPESDREFQAFDYVSHMYEIVGPPAEAGYVSFIPQVDGLVTVKRKWFTKAAELRREVLDPNLNIEPAQFSAYVATMTQGTIRRLPQFRRKRLDVNFESLATGNVFGIYFDICRAGEGADLAAFAQCEVEYCRTRCCFGTELVSDEWEHVCGFVGEFLVQNSISFDQNLFSKLDFVRDVDAMSTKRP